jgi:hypothetical protein
MPFFICAPHGACPGTRTRQVTGTGSVRPRAGWSIGRAAIPALYALLLCFTPQDGGAQRPWAAGELRLMRDNQPRDVLRASAEYGTFPSGDFSLALLLSGEQLSADSPAAAPGLRERVTSTTASAGLAATHALPAARTGLRGSARALFGGPGGEGGPLWSAGARTDVGAGFALRALAERDRYGWTVASVDTLVLFTRALLALDRAAAPGWAGELAGSRDDFGDGNPVWTAYGWVLGPLSQSAAHSLRLGYAAAWQDAQRTTWQPAPGSGPAVGQPAAGTELPGVYAPYHSPHDVRTHSALANAAVAVGSGWLRLDGSVGFHARETAPVIIVGAPPALPSQLQFHERAFTPWRVAGGWVGPLNPATWLTVEAARESGAYYTLNTVRLAINRGF